MDDSSPKPIVSEQLVLFLFFFHFHLSVFLTYIVFL